MAISGVITLGLLDSTSDVITLGLTPSDVTPPTIPGIEWNDQGQRLHWAVPVFRTHWKLGDGRTHWTSTEE